jgi:transcriptional regulator with XRE-family HTH domain
MTYASEEIINALKKGREAKGLSQRDLSARTGVPQSHISKIESGSADIRLSSLIELARALDLEVKLVPRKALPAVDSVVRSTAPAVPATETYRNAVKEFQRTLGTIDKLRLAYPDLSTLNKLQENLRTISNFRTIDKYLDTIKRVTQPLHALQKEADRLQQLDKALRLSTKNLREIEEAANRAQTLRNQLVHAAPSSQPRRAYRLDDDDDDRHHEHKEPGDG